MKTETKIIAICGAGGKTSRIWNLRDAYVAQGDKVCILTTTHMAKESFTDLSGDPAQIIEKMNQDGWVMAGLPAVAKKKQSTPMDSSSFLQMNPSASVSNIKDNHHVEKITFVDESCYQAICQAADIVLIEADGSKHMSIKVPNDTEPVIPDNVTDIEIIMGTWDIGRPVEEVVFRHHLLRYEEGLKRNSSDRTSGIDKHNCIKLTDGLSIDQINVTKDLVLHIMRNYYVNPLQEKYPEASIRCYLSEKVIDQETLCQRKYLLSYVEQEI